MKHLIKKDTKVAKQQTFAQKLAKKQLSAKQLTSSQMVAVKGGSQGVSTFDLVL